MICNNCQNEFTNINGLKFCPYCGSKIEEKIDLEVEEIPDKIYNGERENIVEEDVINKKKQDTLTMPVITKEDIMKYKRDKFVASFKKIFMKMNMKVLIPIIALLVVIGVGAFAYTFLNVKLVDEVRMKEDLVGQIVTFGVSIIL